MILRASREARVASSGDKKDLQAGSPTRRPANLKKLTSRTRREAGKLESGTREVWGYFLQECSELCLQVAGWTVRIWIMVASRSIRSLLLAVLGLNGLVLRRKAR